ncbi:hypothetical protein A0128_00870 [Leptospira tipperaryensis]|uniref:Uncharacterized protein n=1 Tax=Leptospira tipperaryensis TaxID=2564040 RepID=A0A1D7USQ2_9LEPT|nr:hypothetical protein [Leptospira tipperaryensis]AOP32554.1 hypothetical protein A0128_00870 [Leptospira tipperaryensis]
MNLTKKQKILRSIRVAKDVFEEAWKEVPDHMIRKLKAEELADYMIRHVIPVIERRRIISASYVRKVVCKKEIAIA